MEWMLIRVNPGPDLRGGKSRKCPEWHTDELCILVQKPQRTICEYYTYYSIFGIASSLLMYNYGVSVNGGECNFWRERLNSKIGPVNTLQHGSTLVFRPFVSFFSKYPTVRTIFFPLVTMGLRQYLFWRRRRQQRPILPLHYNYNTCFIGIYHTHYRF